jgi:hypothetical protein
MEITGLPVHALVVHAAVVFAPLAVLSALIFAAVPKWRYLSRWPTVILAVIAFVTVWVARLSGNSLATDVPVLADRVTTHASRGNQLSWLILLFMVVVAVAVWALPGDSGLVSGGGARESRVAALDKVLPVLLVIVALLVLVWTILTGDAGARAVWEGVL